MWTGGTLALRPSCSSSPWRWGTKPGWPCWGATMRVVSKWSQRCPKFVSKLSLEVEVPSQVDLEGQPWELSQSNPKVVLNLSQSYPKLCQIQSCLNVALSCLEVVPKLSLVCPKVAKKSWSFHKVSTLSQSCFVANGGYEGLQGSTVVWWKILRLKMGLYA